MSERGNNKALTYLTSPIVISSALSGDFPSSSKLDEFLITENLSERQEESERHDELVKKRQMGTNIRDILSTNATLQKKQYNVLDKIESLARRLEGGMQTSRQRFEQFELLDDLIEMYSDLSDVQMAVGRGNAMRLAKYAPLETLQQEDLLDMIPVLDEEREHRKPQAKMQNDLGVFPLPVHSQRVTAEVTQKSINQIVPADETNAQKNTECLIVPESLPPKIFERILPALQENNGPVHLDVTANNFDENTDLNNDVLRTEEAMPSTSNEIRNNESIPEPVPNAGNSSASSAEESDSQHFEKTSTRKSDTVKRTTSAKSGRKPVKKSTKKVAGRRSATRAPGKGSQTSTPEYEPLPKRSKRKTTEEKKYTRQNSQADSDVNPDEQIYCLCKEISYGQMICCDNSKCTIEWFHFGCVEITTNPSKGQKWYCPLCRGDKATIMKR